VDAEDAVTGVRVVHDVEGAVTGGDDRRAVHRRRVSDPDERAVARPCDRAVLEVREREASRAGLRDARGAEVRCTLEVDDRLAEPVLIRVGDSSVTVCTASGLPIARLPSLGA